MVCLIGKTYTVTSGQPISVVDQSSGDIEIEGNGTTLLTICWPVEVYALEGNGSSFLMCLSPDNLGGSFFWYRHCCEVYGDGLVYRYGCTGSCGCGGCYAEGCYDYEGYLLDATGGWCGCEPGEGYPEDPATSPGVSVSFSKNAIIFEDEYDNSDTDHQPWRSTATELGCSVNGGPNGGYVSINITGDSGLVQYTGRTFPISQFVSPNESISFVNRYKAVEESASANDIIVTATFEENETGWVDTSSATATAVRVEFKVKTRPPNNRCWYRHTYGVRETVECIQNPQLPLVSLVARGGGRASAGTFVCPIVEEECPIAVQCGEAEYIPSMVVIEPSGVMITTVWAERYSIPTNFPGGIGMGMRMYLLPNYVCFSGIAVYEVPNDDGWGVGYFTNQYFRDWLSHTRRIGAGEWCDVGEDNFVATDHPAIEVKIPHVTEDGLELSISGGPWQYGEIHMPTPMGWNEKGTRGHVVEFKRFAALEMQLMSLLENGQTGVRKYRNEVLRNMDGSIYINRRLQNESEIIDRSSGTN